MDKVSQEIKQKRKGFKKFVISVSLEALAAMTRDLKVDGCQSNFGYYAKTIIFLNKFYDFFCRQHSLMNRSCYNNLFQFTQHSNFRKLNRVLFAH